MALKFSFALQFYPLSWSSLQIIFCWSPVHILGYECMLCSVSCLPLLGTLSGIMMQYDIEEAIKGQISRNYGSCLRTGQSL